MFVISFRSRTSTIGFSRILNRYGYRTSIINTPKHISSSCSLSVKVEIELSTLKSILLGANIRDYLGVYTMYNNELIRIF